MRIQDINIREFVPILTGGPERQYTAIRPSGLVGSLRWLAEWVFFCLGETQSTFAEPTGSTGDHPVAEIFGSTESRSRFDLLVDDSSIDFKKEAKRPPGKIGMQFVFRDAFSPDYTLSTIIFLLKFAEKFAALGAKTSSGYGIFKVEDGGIDAFSRPSMVAQMRNCLFGADISIDNDNARNIGAQGTDGYKLTSQKVRKKLRRLIDDKYTRHGFFGTFSGGWRMGRESGNGPKKSVIRVSHLWKCNEGWKMRIWGFAAEEVPEQVGRIIEIVRNGDNNDDLVHLISDALGINADGITVRSFPDDFSKALEKVHPDAGR
jgi:CRISPR type III-B/RAMP module RAMP protein Cmr1